LLNALSFHLHTIEVFIGTKQLSLHFIKLLLAFTVSWLLKEDCLVMFLQLFEFLLTAIAKKLIIRLNLTSCNSDR
jgi:hypothetical protein